MGIKAERKTRSDKLRQLAVLVDRAGLVDLRIIIG